MTVERDTIRELQQTEAGFSAQSWLLRYCPICDGYEVIDSCHRLSAEGEA